ncbi:MAG: hypothetical protein AABW51_05555 [Nanoarchaeota archaeon]
MGLKFLTRSVKARKKQTPDFVGSWTLGEVALNDGLFYMYIENRGRINSNSKPLHISGTIDDKFGTSQFDGSLSDDEIKFSKLYVSKAQKKGAGGDFTGRVDYEGRKVDGIFLGAYRLEGLSIIGIERDLWSEVKGKFIMYSPTKENQPKVTHFSTTSSH